MGQVICIYPYVPLTFFHSPDAPDHHLQVYSGIPAGQVPYPPLCLVVGTPMHDIATAACRFF